jgi:hypothetical protein
MLIRMCTNKNPRERSTATELMDVPWPSEEDQACNRVFGPTGRLSIGELIHPRSSFSNPKLVTVARNPTKLVLFKPASHAPTWDSNPPTRPRWRLARNSVGESMLNYFLVRINCCFGDRGPLWEMSVLSHKKNMERVKPFGIGIDATRD